MSRVVQLSSNPGVSYEVDDGEYERLVRLGLVLNAPANPQPIDYFDDEVAALLGDQSTQSNAVIRGLASLRAQAIAPANPAVGDLWVT